MHLVLAGPAWTHRHAVRIGILSIVARNLLDHAAGDALRLRNGTVFVSEE